MPIEAQFCLIADQVLSRHIAIFGHPRVDGYCARKTVESGGGEDAQSEVDMLHLRPAVLFIINPDLARLVPDVTSVLAFAVLKDGHKDQLA